MANKLVTCTDLSISYNNRTVLNDVSFSICKKEIVTIIGPNGSGKTSLLKLVCGLQKANSGTIEKKPNLAIGYMPQKLSIDRILPLTVRRFLRLNGKGNGMRGVADVESIAQDFGIIHLMRSQIHDISGGELQRVMLARAVLLRPNLLVLDEPTQGLDINGQAEFYKLISDLRDKIGCGILLVSHDLNMVMASTDRVLCLNKHICCEGTPEDINNNPEYIALFGEDAVKNVALYSHKHDHKHCLDGHVEGGEHAG